MHPFKIFCHCSLCQAALDLLALFLAHAVTVSQTLMFFPAVIPFPCAPDLCLGVNASLTRLLVLIW